MARNSANNMNMQQIMAQAQKMQEQLEEAEEGLKDVTIDASAGGGTVKATVTGDMRLQSITIDPEALDPDDVEFLQDMIVAAVNEALRGAEEAANKQLGSITGGMNIPGMSF